MGLEQTIETAVVLALRKVLSGIMNNNYDKHEIREYIEKCIAVYVEPKCKSCYDKGYSSMNDKKIPCKKCRYDMYLEYKKYNV